MAHTTQNDKMIKNGVYLTYNGSRDSKPLSINEQLMVVKLLNECVLEGDFTPEDIALIQRHLDWHKKLSTQYGKAGKSFR